VDLGSSVGWGLAIGASLLAGAAAAALLRLPSKVAATLTAFGGGILFSAVALELTIAEGELGVALLAGILIGNVVEAYGAAQPIIAGGHTKRFAITLMTAIGFALAFATVLGGTLLADASGEVVGTAQAVAGGAVLAVVSIAIVPHAFAEVNRIVASATVAGFIAGYLLS
jgi:ZIP family zinc transporter